MSARDRLLKRKPKEIDIDGEKVFIRSLTVAEFLHIEPLGKDPERVQEFSFYVISKGTIDEDGETIFEVGEDDKISEESYEQLSALPLSTVKRLMEEITELSKTGKLKAIEKNSDATL